MASPTRSENLKRLLKPRHIAFFGGAALGDPIRSCETAGFAGEIWVVNPGRDEVAGRTCYRSVAELPEAPDASFIAVNREQTVAVRGARPRHPRSERILVHAADGAETLGDGVAVATM